MDPKTFAVYDYAFTGAANPLDITGGRRIVAYAGKVPDLKGSTLTSAMDVRLKDDGLEISRTGAGVSMKIQAKNCANGGLFQMEPERDGRRRHADRPHARARTPSTTTTRTSGPARATSLPYKDTTATVVRPREHRLRPGPANFVGRDSPQVATRVAPRHLHHRDSRPRRPGGVQNVDHCGGVERLGRRVRRPHGRRLRRGRDRGRPARHHLHRGLPGREPGQGPGRDLGVPFPVPATNRFSPRF